MKPEMPKFDLQASSFLGHLGMWVCGNFLLLSPLHAQTTNEPSASSTDAPELTEAADLAIERGLQYLISTQNPDGSWNEGTAEKAESYPHKTPMAIIILGTPHRYIPVYQE